MSVWKAVKKRLLQPLREKADTEQTKLSSLIRIGDSEGVGMQRYYAEEAERRWYRQALFLTMLPALIDPRNWIVALTLKLFDKRIAWFLREAERARKSAPVPEGGWPPAVEGIRAWALWMERIENWWSAEVAREYLEPLDWLVTSRDRAERRLTRLLRMA